jgi:hypothetical protein
MIRFPLFLFSDEGFQLLWGHVAQISEKPESEMLK